MSFWECFGRVVSCRLSSMESFNSRSGEKSKARMRGEWKRRKRIKVLSFTLSNTKKMLLTLQFPLAPLVFHLSSPTARGGLLWMVDFGPALTVSSIGGFCTGLGKNGQILLRTKLLGMLSRRKQLVFWMGLNALLDGDVPCMAFPYFHNAAP